MSDSITLADSDGEYLILSKYRIRSSGGTGFAIDAYSNDRDDPQVELRLSQQDIDRLKEWLNNDPR